jgi:regulatory protein
MDDQKISSLKSKDAFEVAYQKAIHFLSYRARTEREITQKLEKEGYDRELIGEMIARLRQQGLIEDTNFSKEWVEARGLSKPRGHRLLALELRQRGIAEETIQEALAGVGDETELALRAASKFARRLEKLDWNHFRQKMSAYLVRRGFDYSTTSNVVHQIWNQSHPVNDTITLLNGDMEDE